jgi:hypothetical protein
MKKNYRSSEMSVTRLTNKSGTGWQNTATRPDFNFSNHNLQFSYMLIAEQLQKVQDFPEVERENIGDGFSRWLLPGYQHTHAVVKHTR